MHFRSVAAALILAALMIPHAAFGQGAWPEDCKLVRVAQLPMTLKSNDATVPGLVNGKTVTLAIDTGGYASSLTKTATDNLGLVRHRMNSVIIRDMGGKVADEYVRVDSFRIGNLERDGVYLMVMESFPGIDGLIAPDLLRNYDVELDFAGRQFSLFKHHPCADRAVYWTGSYAVVPFGVTGDGHMRVPVSLDGKDTYAVLDTGAGVSALSMQNAKHMFDLGADNPNVEAAGQLTGASGSQVNAYTYPFKTLTMGGVTVANPRIALTEGHNFLGDNDASILLGMDVLSKLHLYIAYREQKLYITDAQAQ
jgi:predicted aspartyl protease